MNGTAKQKPFRIAVGGIQHETNTFARDVADLARFKAADAWPAWVSGDALATAVAGRNLPVAGFLAKAAELDFTVAPLLWCSAPPSGPVTRAAFAAILEKLDSALDAAEKDGPLDGLYLDLHGAMVSETGPDGDGDILRHCRQRLGPDMAIVASLDLHANVSPAMCDAADQLVVYRTYPHIDMAETGARTAALLARQLADGNPRHMALRPSPFLVPLVAQYTGAEPAMGLYARLDGREGGGVECVSLAMGFPPADVADCGPAVIACGTDKAAVEAAADATLADLLAHEHAFAADLLSPEAAIEAALQTDTTAGPVILADTQDNPGGGGSGDTVGLLKALVDAHGQFKPGEVVFGVLADGDAARAAHEAGVRAKIPLALGARDAALGETPLQATYTVLATSNGQFAADGTFFGGAAVDLGPMAALETAGVCVVVSTRRQQAAEPAMFRHLGIEPGACRVLALKSSVHFRADFEAMASRVLVVEAPGVNIADPRKLDYRHLRPGVRLYPGG